MSKVGSDSWSRGYWSWGGGLAGCAVGATGAGGMAGALLMGAGVRRGMVGEGETRPAPDQCWAHAEERPAPWDCDPSVTRLARAE